MLELIKQIEIRYFRSIYYLKLNNIKSLNVISGANDVGKSNILKALNLFFNFQTDFKTNVNFYKDFNLVRLQQVRQESIKGKQFIQIKITFNRGDRSPNTLPNNFTVTRTWHRDSTRPTQSDDLETRLKGTTISITKARASLSRFLDSIKYVYVPAIKDKEFFNHIMIDLQEALSHYGNAKGNLIKNKLQELNTDISELGKRLYLEFENATGITSSLNLPTTLQSLYNSFLINTVYGEYEVLLDQRGDGIKVRYIPSILFYISHISNHQYIWGFEEPENSLEYKLCTKMASDFQNTYSKTIQIFTTSHSPAFISLKSDNTSLYRIYNHGLETKTYQIKDNDQDSVDDLNEDLGLTKLLQEQHEYYKNKLEELQRQQKELQKLETEILNSKKPILLTEGKTDKIIIETAWDKLYPGEEIPFNVSSCDLEDEANGGGKAGCGILRKHLESVRHDNQSLVIGLFDYDKAGIEAFQLDKNYSLVDGYSNVKKSKNGKGYAILLPIPPGKEEFAKYKNLPIEYYFHENDLKKEVEGCKLGLIQEKIPTKFNGVTIEEKETTELYFARIDRKTKKVFAEKIVPTFPQSSFKNFEILFSLINKILIGQL